jgi:predicted transcriptional regulator
MTARTQRIVSEIESSPQPGGVMASLYSNENFPKRVVEEIRRLATRMRLDWQTVNRIMERAVERGLLRREERPIKKAGGDEKSFRRGYVYASILS